MILRKYEYIVTAYAEYCAGPGWSNNIIWVIIGDGDHKLRQEAIQPEDQTPAMLHLFPVCATAHASLMKAANSACKRGK